MVCFGLASLIVALWYLDWLTGKCIIIIIIVIITVIISIIISVIVVNILMTITIIIFYSRSMTRKEAAENGKEFAIAVNCHQRQQAWQPEQVIPVFCCFLARCQNGKTTKSYTLLLIAKGSELLICMKVEACLRTRTTEELFEAYDKGTFRFASLVYLKMHT